MNRFYTIKVDENLDKNLKQLQEKLSRSDEKIVEQTTVDGNLVITTEGKKSKNLLFDQVKRGEMKDPFNIPGKILKG